MHFRFTILLLLSTFLAYAQSDNSLIKQHVFALAHDSMEGRLAGTDAEKSAALYIAKSLEAQGIERYKGSYLKPFVYTIGNNPHDTTKASVKTTVTAVNVMGFLDNQADKTIVVGAHFDHIGRNERGSSTDPKQTGTIHNGADDNASGVAGLIELARLLKRNGMEEKSNFLFIAFSGEEDGLMGSKEILKTLKNDNQPIAFMLNMDMIGRIDSTQRLYIAGVGTDKQLKSIAEKHNMHFKLVFDESGIGPSDYTSFYLENIPVLGIFSGLHTDYHKPSDDIEKINFEDAGRIIDMMYDVLLDISDKQLVFQKTKSSMKQAAVFKVSLGIMPDYASSNGLRVDNVSEGKPGAKAGLQRGDIIKGIGDYKVQEVYSYMEALSKYKEGDTVPVIIERQGKIMDLKVTF